MADVDDELIARTLQWCAAAGRSSSADEVRAALAPLSWDQLLAARTLLADPPPARPLGPRALADLARGTPPDVAAERERAGQYRSAPDEPDAGGDAEHAGVEDAIAGAPIPRAPPRRRRAGPAAAAPVIRRARDRVASVPAGPPPLPAVEELLASEGRAVVERLIREHGARRGPILAALAAGWRRRDGAPVADGDLEQLLDVHGLTRAFGRRERDELLHALRAAGGVLTRAAESVGIPPDAFRASLARLGATAEAEVIRGVHRDEIRRRGTLSERVRLVLDDSTRLADLGVLEELEQDLRRRLPEHLRALRAAGTAPLTAAVARTLSVPVREIGALLSRLGLATADAEPAAPATSRPRRPAGGERAPARRNAASTGSREGRPTRPGGARPGPTRRSGRGAPSGPAPSAPRRDAPRSPRTPRSPGTPRTRRGSGRRGPR